MNGGSFKRAIHFIIPTANLPRNYDNLTNTKETTFLGRGFSYISNRKGEENMAAYILFKMNGKTYRKKADDFNGIYHLLTDCYMDREQAIQIADWADTYFGIACDLGDIEIQVYNDDKDE